MYNFCKFSIPENGKKVIWEITNECNFACKYCIFSSSGKKIEGELLFDDIKLVLSNLKKAGFSYIKFTGGEPFIRDDFCDILKEANDLKFSFDVSTNASLLTDEKILILKKLNGLKFIHVSLDGYVSEINDFLRGKNSFNKTIEGIKLLKSHDLPVRIGHVLYEKNEKNIKDFLMLCDSLNVEMVAFSTMEPVGRMKGKKEFLIKESVLDLKDIIERLSLNYKMKITHNLSSNLSLTNQKEACPGGNKFIFVNHLGVFSPCTWFSDRFITKDAIKIFEEVKRINKSSVNVSCPMKYEQIDFIYDIAKKKIELSKTFSDNSLLYLFATENLNFLKLLDVKDKKILSVASSYDQVIDFYLAGAKEVICFDSNKNAKYMKDIKFLSLQHLSYKDFLNLFFKFDINVFKKIEKFLTLDDFLFWSNVIKNKDFSWFNVNFFDEEIKKNNIAYIKDEQSFLLAKNIIKNKLFNFNHLDVQNLKFDCDFDMLYFSNIADYSHKMFSDDYLTKFKEKCILNNLNLLKKNGMFIFAYIYDALNINNSKERNILNDDDVRLNYFSNIANYEYGELYFKSYIENAEKDAICFLKGD